MTADPFCAHLWGRGVQDEQLRGSVAEAGDGRDLIMGRRGPQATWTHPVARDGRQGFKQVKSMIRPML